MQIGVLVGLSEQIGTTFEKITRMGLHSCQLTCWEPAMMNGQVAEQVKLSANQWGVTISALWVGWEGPCLWNLVDGPVTIGLVPPAYRWERVKTLQQGGRFAAQIGAADVITHVGFIPENPGDADYSGLVNALRYLVRDLQQMGCNFLFETGQETPVTLLRTIEDIGLPNVGINLDPAN